MFGCTLVDQEAIHTSRYVQANRLALSGTDFKIELMLLISCFYKTTHSWGETKIIKIHISQTTKIEENKCEKSLKKEP